MIHGSGPAVERAIREKLSAENAQLRERISLVKDLVAGWRNTEKVLREQGSEGMAAGYFNCSEDLSSALARKIPAKACGCDPQKRQHCEICDPDIPEAF